MRKYKKQETEKVAEVFCNRCGKKLRVENGIIMEGVFPGSIVWGYFSGKDAQRHEFDLCEDCYDAVTEEFSIPVDKKNEKELL